MHSNSFCIRICAITFYVRAKFIAHLWENHDLKNIDSEHLLKNHIDNNSQIAFWCGFCIKVVAFKQKGVQVFNERFDHIAYHFKEGKSINNWYHINKDQLNEAISTDCLYNKGTRGKIW